MQEAHDKLLRHSLVVSSFVSIAAHHGVPSKQEPRCDYEDCKNAQRPDAVFFLPQDAVEVDVSSTSPVCPSNMLATVKAGAQLSSSVRALRMSSTVRRRVSEATALGHLFSIHMAALGLMFELSCACYHPCLDFHSVCSLTA